MTPPRPRAPLSPATIGRVSLVATLATAAAALATTPAVASTPTTAAELAPPSSFDVGDRPGTSRAAFEERVATILTQRLGDAFTVARYRWIRCPQAGRRYAREWGDHDVACQAEIGNDRKRRALHIDFRYRDPGWSPAPEPMTYRYHQDGPFALAPRACASRAYERLARRAGYRIVAFRSDGGWEGCDPATAMLTRVIVRRLEGPNVATFDAAMNEASPNVPWERFEADLGCTRPDGSTSSRPASDTAETPTTAEPPCAPRPA